MAVVALGDGEPLEGGRVAICNSIPDCREGWIPDSRGWIPDSQVGFRIPNAWISDSKDKNMLDSGFPYMGRKKQRAKFMHYQTQSIEYW